MQSISWGKRDVHPYKKNAEVISVLLVWMDGLFYDVLSAKIARSPIAVGQSIDADACA